MYGAVTYCQLFQCNMPGILCKVFQALNLHFVINFCTILGRIFYSIDSKVPWRYSSGIIRFAELSDLDKGKRRGSQGCGYGRRGVVCHQNSSLRDAGKTKARNLRLGLHCCATALLLPHKATRGIWHWSPMFCPIDRYLQGRHICPALTMLLYMDGFL